MVKERIQYFDVLKGIAILLVVMGHVDAFCLRQFTPFFFKLIGEIHMPIFFFISGYLTYKAKNGVQFVSPNMWKRFKQLMIPFFVMSLLWFFYLPQSHLYDFNPDLYPVSLYNDVYAAFYKRGYWFTLCLFEIFLIYYPVSKLFNKMRNTSLQILTLVVIYALLVVASYLWSDPDNDRDIIGVGQVAYFFPIFMAGVYASRFADAWKRAVSNTHCYTVAFILFVISWYMLAEKYVINSSWDGYLSIYNDIQYILRPIFHISFALVAVAVAKPWIEGEYAKLEPTVEGKPQDTSRLPWVVRAFTYMGQESLSIYLMHYFFLFPIAAMWGYQESFMGYYITAFVPQVFMTLIVASGIVSITLLLNLFIMRSKILSFLMIGK